MFLANTTKMWRRVSLLLLFIFSFALLDFSISALPAANFQGAMQIQKNEESTVSGTRVTFDSSSPSHSKNSTSCDDEGCQDHQCHFGHCNSLLHPPVFLVLMANVSTYSLYRIDSPGSIYLPSHVEPPIAKLA